MGKLSLKEVITNNTEIFYVYDASIELYGTETAYGWQCIGIMAEQHYYLGNSPVSVDTAIKLYQNTHNIILTDDEVKEVISDNGRL